MNKEQSEDVRNTSMERTRDANLEEEKEGSVHVPITVTFSAEEQEKQKSVVPDADDLSTIPGDEAAEDLLVGDDDEDDVELQQQEETKSAGSAPRVIVARRNARQGSSSSNPRLRNQWFASTNTGRNGSHHSASARSMSIRSISSFFTSSGDNAAGPNAANVSLGPDESCASCNGSTTAAICCAICLSSYAKDDRVVVSRHCTHIFHHECLFEWLTRHDDCPCCRVPMITGQEWCQTSREVWGEGLKLRPKVESLTPSEGDEFYPPRNGNERAYSGATRPATLSVMFHINYDPRARYT